MKLNCWDIPYGKGCCESCHKDWERAYDVPLKYKVKELDGECCCTFKDFVNSNYDECLSIAIKLKEFEFKEANHE